MALKSQGGIPVYKKSRGYAAGNTGGIGLTPIGTIVIIMKNNTGKSWKQAAARTPLATKQRWFQIWGMMSIDNVRGNQEHDIFHHIITSSPTVTFFLLQMDLGWYFGQGCGAGVGALFCHVGAGARPTAPAPTQNDAYKNLEN